VSDRHLVVYVEDHPENFALVQKALEATGRFTVVCAPSAEEGLELVTSQRPDVILIDLDLPGMDGLSMARALRADPELAAIPIIVVTASVMKNEREEAFEIGCMAFVEKPFDIAELREHVRRAAQPRGAAT
jgi:CheY-like chemotaxis protein